MSAQNIIVKSLMNALKNRSPSFSSLQKVSDTRPDSHSSLYPGYYKICPCPPEPGEKKKKLPESKGSGTSWRIWKHLSLFLAVPTVVLFSGFVMLTHEKKDRPEFIPYEHLRIRRKRFPWRDGKTSLFHNPHVNPLPEGYEDELETKEGGDENDADEEE